MSGTTRTTRSVRHRAGLTLVELLLAVAITALIGGAISIVMTAAGQNLTRVSEVRSALQRAHATHARLRAEQIAAAKHHTVAHALFHFRKERPIARTDVSLSHRSAMHGDGGNAEGERTVENLEEMALALRFVIHPATHFQRDRSIVANRIADALDDVEGNVGL